MSYYYSNVDHYSPSPSASTPQNHTLAPAQWDTSNPPNLQDSSEALQHHQHHQHHHSLQSPIALSAISAPQTSMYHHHQQPSEHSTPLQTPVYEPPTVIQLQERQPRRSVQQRKADQEALKAAKARNSTKPISPLTLHGISTNDRNEDVQSPLSLSDHGHSELASSMPIRHNRSMSKGQVRFTSHPYASRGGHTVRSTSVGSANDENAVAGNLDTVTPSSILSNFPVPYATIATCATTADSLKSSPVLSAIRCDSCLFI